MRPKVLTVSAIIIASLLLTIVSSKDTEGKDRGTDSSYVGNISDFINNFFGGSTEKDGKKEPIITVKNVDTACEDKTTYTFKAQGKNRHCAWISGDPDRKKFCKKKKNGVSVKNKCKNSCNNCKGNSQNKENSQTASSDSASNSLTGECADDPGKHFGKKKNRSCSKEKNKKGTSKFLKKCKSDALYSTKCPKSCDMCFKCVDDESFKFKYWSSQRDCAWLNLNVENKKACVNKPRVKEKCKGSCNNCETVVPTFSPTEINYDPPPQQSCTDDSQFVSSNGKSCSYIRRNGRESSCQDEKVRRYCPTTVCLQYRCNFVLRCQKPLSNY